jgi:alkylation response protein AidB-like acyl-CoA dehydrogenase
LTLSADYQRHTEEATSVARLRSPRRQRRLRQGRKVDQNAVQPRSRGGTGRAGLFGSLSRGRHGGPVPMDFSLSREEQEWHDAAAAFGAAELGEGEGLAARDRAEEFWREGYERCGRMGVLGLPVPEEFDGKGQSLCTTIAAMEGLGYGCPDTGLVFALSASLWTVTMPILTFGDASQKQRYLPGLCAGSLLGANAASEPEAGSDIFAMQTLAAPRGDGWVLTGRKIWITAGPVADLFVVFATTDPSKGALGITAFLVPRETPGLKVVRTIAKLGMRTAPMAELAFDGCILPAESLLGREGRGAQIFNAALEWERGAILAGALGTMRRQLERVVSHARTRKQFERPISKFQSVSNRIVDMKLRLETCRPLVYKFAWLKGQGKEATLEAALAKLHVSECFVANSLDAVRIFGASGYATETGLERDLRDSVGGLIFSGTNDIQRNIIAQHLRL